MLNRFLRTFLFAAIALIVFASFIFIHPSSRAYIDPFTGEFFGEGGSEPQPTSSPEVDKDALKGGVIMGKLGNETAKAELGRAAWKLMHTTTLRFPDKPTQDERAALKSYFLLQARLYPCGECAEEFMQLLKKHPPQTSSRKIASFWLCDIHNMVNKRLGKSKFDCTKLDETYDCGCGDEPLAGAIDKEHDEDGTHPQAGMVKGG